MAEFTRAFRIQGFDRFPAPRWQMVPKDGVRYVILRNGAGLTVTSRDTGKCTVREVQEREMPAEDRQPFERGDRFFRLCGVAHGSAIIDAKTGAGAVDVSLEASVKNAKRVKVKFNLVRDNASHRTRRDSAAVNREFAIARWMYREQLNVKLESAGVRWVQVPQDLGDVVRFTTHIASVPAAEHEWDVVTALRDPVAELNVFFVWEYEQDNSPAIDHANAGTLDGNCIFEDNIGDGVPMWRTLSHEIGHHLGVDDHYDDGRKYELMYGRSDRGIHIPKAHADTMNP